MCGVGLRTSDGRQVYSWSVWGGGAMEGKVKLQQFCKHWRALTAWGNASYTLMLVYDMIYLLTAVGLSPGGSTHLHTNNTWNNTNNNRTTQITTSVEECGPCPVFASITLAFALQVRKKHRETSVRVGGECQLAKSIQNRAYLSIRIRKHNTNT
jgi:hypothetical protein